MNLTGTRNTQPILLKFPSREVAREKLAEHVRNDRVRDTDHKCWFDEIGTVYEWVGGVTSETRTQRARKGWYVLVHAESIPPDCEPYALARNTTGRRFA